jgi:hypothetical protein
MSGSRQNTQRKLTRRANERGEAPSAGTSRAEPVMAAAAHESPAATWLYRPLKLNPIEPPCTDPYARWCGRGGAARRPPIPVIAALRPVKAKIYRLPYGPSWARSWVGLCSGRRHLAPAELG